MMRLAVASAALLHPMVGQATPGGGARPELVGPSAANAHPHPSAAASAAPLTLTLTSFTAVRQGRTVLVAWATASEQSSRVFQVERSGNGTTGWKTVGCVAAAGSSFSARAYSMLDQQVLPGFSYYRLRCTNEDGTTHFSHLAVVCYEPPAAGTVSVFPNPVASELTVAGSAPGSVLTLLDTMGNVYWETPTSDAGLDKCSVQALRTVHYLLKLKDPDGHVTTVSFTKE